MNRSHGFTNTVSRKLGKAAQSPNAQRPFYDNLEVGVSARRHSKVSKHVKICEI